MDFEIPFADGDGNTVIEEQDEDEDDQLKPDASVVFSEYHELLACRICLATDTKLISIHEFQLGGTFENIIGYTVAQDDGFPQYLCHYCCSLLTKFETFRGKYEKSQFILTRALIENQEITTDFLRTLDRKAHDLALPLEEHTAEEPINMVYIEEPKPVVPIKIKASKLKPIPSDQLVVQKVQEDGREIVRVFYIAKPSEVGLTLEETKPEEQDLPADGEVATTVVEEEDEGRSISVAQHPNIKMVILSKTEQIEEFRNRQKTVGYTSAFLKCDICYRGFLREKSYASHMAMHDPSYGDFECDVCLMRCESAGKLRAHCRAAHQRKYECRLCGRHDATPKAARLHQTWHEGEFYSCSQCNMTFRKSSSLMKHTVERHNKDRLNGHFESHPSDRRTCSACDVQFSSVHAYSVHLLTSANHHGTDGLWLSCKHCGESFDSQLRLDSHARTHQQPVQCDECEFSFLHERGLAIHKGQAHKASPRLFVALKNICEFCGREMESADDLAQHKLTHSGEKPFECYVCNKGFKQAQFLQIHMRVHTKEAPYSCNLCDRRFTHKANLNRHYKVHTGEKPFSCEICNRSFTQSNSLKLHIRTVHLKLPDPYRQNRKNKRQKKDVLKVVSLEDIVNVVKPVEVVKEEFVEYEMEEDDQ